MIARPALIAALLMVGCALPAAATARVGTPRPATTTRADSAKGSAAVRATVPSGPASATVPSGPASAAARNRSAAPARTLEDIHIEGEIPVPQVLFITARDQRRFVGFHHRRYLRTSRKIGEDTAVPSRIIVTGAATLPERSHSDE
jgi:hypothetical protein